MTTLVGIRGFAVLGPQLAAREIRAPIGWLFDSDCQVKTDPQEAVHGFYTEQ